MKISFTKTSRILTTGVIAMAIALVASHSTVNAVTAQLAQANAQQDATKLLGNVNAELTRRSTELKQSSQALNGETGSSNTSATGTDSKECAKDNPKMKEAIDKTNKDSTKANNDIQTLLNQAKTSSTADASKQATATDKQYDEYKIANAQNNIMNALCTQQDAYNNLSQLTQQMQQQQNSGSSDSSSGSSSGSGSTDLTSIIKKVIQLLVAVAALIASIIALVMAIQNGDYTAAATILTTVIGQLESIATILSDCLTELMGGSSSSSDSSSSSSSTN